MTLRRPTASVDLIGFSLLASAQGVILKRIHLPFSVCHFSFVIVGAVFFLRNDK
jgi:hypothetical protein